MNKITLILFLTVCPFISNCFAVESIDSLTEKIYSNNSQNQKDITLSYYSDYFSFVGNDSDGRVAFALDNNRGQDGDKFQAEHFLVLHDEHKGWQKVQGNGAYPNPGKELKIIPNSEAFQFDGNPEEGMQIVSPSNQLKLSIKPIQYHLENKNGMAHLLMGSASAELQWGDRRIQGRVIYEYIFLPQFNRLSRGYTGLWKDFHGIYLMVEGGGDFYYHSQKSELLMPLVGEISGFYFSKKGHPTVLSGIDIKPSNFINAKGTYQWPGSWMGTFNRGSASYGIHVQLSERKTISNWITGGFSMGILSGEISSEKEILKV
jgi:hypothetical protein